MTTTSEIYQPLQWLGYSIVLALVILILVAVLYYFKPMYRQKVGVIALTLGAIGIAICLGVLLFSIIMGSAFLGVISLLILFALEVPTLYIGIISLRQSNPKSISNIKN